MITTNSLGKRIAKTDEQIRAFWRWFGDSKVVDAKGRPLVVYHSTNAEFTSFSSGKRKRGAWGAGFYFAQNIEKNAKERYGTRTLRCYLRILNPAAKTDVIQSLDECDGKKEPFSHAMNRLVAVHLRKKGFDGIRMPVSQGETDWVAFRPAQIKSVDNRGTFDPNDPVLTNPLLLPSAKLPRRLRPALKRGTKVEMEHTRNRRTARTIASHHLQERGDYYKLLARMEKSKRNPSVIPATLKFKDRCIVEMEWASGRPGPKNVMKQGQELFGILKKESDHFWYLLVDQVYLIEVHKSLAERVA